jgi:Methyltransferase domain
MDLSKYDFALTPDNWPFAWHMDDLHVMAIYELARSATGNVVEVGCFRGRSTAALVEALNDGADFTLHLVDVKITLELLRVIGMCRKPDRIKIHETHSTSFLLESASLWIIDGDHTWPAVLDVLNALASNAVCIVMHDTRAHEEGFKECEGSSLAAQALRHHRGRFYIEDCKHRDGMLTHRGLMISFDIERVHMDFSTLRSLFAY